MIVNLNYSAQVEMSNISIIFSNYCIFKQIKIIIRGMAIE